MSKQDVIDLISERKNFFGDEEDEGYGKNPLIGEYARKILNKLKSEKDELEVDFIVESLTHLGYAPNIYYDDNGYFACSDDGIETFPLEEGPQDIELHVCIGKGSWKETIRQAVYNYLKNLKK